MAKQSKTVEVQEITDSEFDTTIKDNELVVVDFFAEWCMPCVIQSPIIEELAQSYAEKVVFVKVNVDDNQNTASKYKVLSIPTLLVFKKGQVVDRVVGTVPFDALKDRVGRYT